MQFREKKNLACCILTSNNYMELIKKVEKIGEGFIFEDLQYSSTTKLNGEIEYSVFIIYQL